MFITRYPLECTSSMIYWYTTRTRSTFNVILFITISNFVAYSCSRIFVRGTVNVIQQIKKDFFFIYKTIWIIWFSSFRSRFYSVRYSFSIETRLILLLNVYYKTIPYGFLFYNSTFYTPHNINYYSPNTVPT